MDGSLEKSSFISLLKWVKRESCPLKKYHPMQKSPLVELLKKMSKKEHREFRKWLQSPFHNQRDDVYHLYDYLTTRNHLEDDKFLEKERIFPKIFPKLSYDDLKLRQTIFFLSKTLEEYVAYKELMEDEVRAQMALAGVYRKKNMDKAYLKTTKNIEKLLQKPKTRNEHFLRNEYLLQKEKYRFFENQQRNIKMNLQEVSDALDATYLADKLRQACLMLAHQKVYKTEYSPGLLDEVLTFVQDNEYDSVPAIGVYYYGYKTFTSGEDSEEYFNKLKSSIFKNGGLFPHDELRDIYLMAINFCIGKINAGEKAFVRESFELYKMGLNQDVILRNKVLSPWTFANICLNALQLEEYEWAYSFIEEYKDAVPEKYRESYVSYLLARYYYAISEYTKARKLLIHADFSDILLNLNAKMLLIKMYYEEDEFDPLESLLESIRTYLHRKKVMGYHRDNFKNVIRLVRKLTRVLPNDKSEVQKLRKEIQDTNPLMEKQWLLEQVDGML